jgi:carboxymethylenebutenolidase
MADTTDPNGLEVEIPAGEGYPVTPAFAILPEGATRGVVVIHEIFGRGPEIDRVVARFARSGYAAVAPELFRAPSKLTCLWHTFGALRTGEGPAVRQASGIRRWLCEKAHLEEKKVGIIGFCFGGGFALAVGRGWGAISTNYGPLPKNPEVLRGLGPTIGCYGGRDLNYGKKGPVLEARLRAVGVPVETHTFPDVGHSFLTDGNRPIMAFLTAPIMHIDYKPGTAEEGWRRILAFFEKHLA